MRTPARSVGSSSRATPWLDNLSRDLLESGAFAELVRDYAVTGATSNPTIFARAILGSDRYDNQLQAAAAAGISNAQATVEQALKLGERLGQPNVLIKVPATAAGVGRSKSSRCGGSTSM